MSRLILFALLGLFMPAQSHAQRPPTTIAQLRGAYRPLLIFAPKPDDPSLNLQLRTLRDSSRALADRNILAIAIPYNAPSPTVTRLTEADAADARHSFHIAPSDFTVLLIGKDGDEKFRSNKPISIDQLNQIVDAMPMRQQEMRQQPH